MLGEPAEWLRALQRGDLPFQEWWERALDADRGLECQLSDDHMPPGPEGDRIETWSIATHLKLWAA
jgi:hypothetical protein